MHPKRLFAPKVNSEWNVRKVNEKYGAENEGVRQRAQNDGFVLYVQLCVLTVQNRCNYQELSFITPGGVN